MKPNLSLMKHFLKDIAISKFMEAIKMIYDSPKKILLQAIQFQNFISILYFNMYFLKRIEIDLHYGFAKLNFYLI